MVPQVVFAIFNFKKIRRFWKELSPLCMLWLSLLCITFSVRQYFLEAKGSGEICQELTESGNKWELVLPSAEHVLDENSTHNPCRRFHPVDGKQYSDLPSPFRPLSVWRQRESVTAVGICQWRQVHSVLLWITGTESNKVSANLFWFWPLSCHSKL